MKFLRELRQPFSASLVKLTTGLADPANFEFARRVNAREKILANGVRQRKRSGMSRTLKAFFVTGMKDCDVIEHGRPTNAAFGKSIGLGMKEHGRNFGVLYTTVHDT